MEKCEPAELPECQWTKYIWSTVPVGLLIAGTFGNILNVVILSRRRMRTSSTSVYLLCLSYGDCAFLWLGMAPRMLLQGYDLDIKITAQFLCKLTSFAPVTAASYSIWTLVLLTSERLFLTKWPVVARSKLNVRTARIAAVTLLIVIVSMTSHFVFVAEVRTVTSTENNETAPGYKLLCTYAPNASMLFYKKIWPLIVLTVLTLIPTAFIVLGNLTILVTILAQRRKLRQINPNGNDRSGDDPKKVKSATKMLFLVSAFFIATTMPFTLGNVIMSLRTVDEPARQVYYAILRNLLYCNFTFNFILYFISGTLFKQEWKSLVQEVRHKIRSLRGQLNIQGQQSTLATSSTLRGKGSTTF